MIPVQILLETGLLAHAKGDLSTAKICYEKVLALDPQNSVANGWLGTIEAQKKNFLKARSHLETALSSSCDPNFLLNYANLLQETNNYRESLLIYLKVIKKGSSPVALSNIAACYNALEQPSQALLFAEQALKIDLSYAEAWCNRGNALNKLRHYEEALSSHERSVELNPNCADAWNNRGVSLRNLGRHQEALASFEHSVELRSDHVEALTNLGAGLNKLQRHEEALRCHEKAIGIKQDYAEAWCNRGIALGDLRRNEGALQSFERAIALRPGYAEAFYNKALLQLSGKDFVNGFANYLWRWKTRDFTSQPIDTTLPSCETINYDSNLLLWGEQGIGDEIFYAGFLSLAQEKVASISLHMDPRLRPIFIRSFPKVILLDRDQNSVGESIDFADCHAPIGDLGYLLGSTHGDIQRTRKPFLLADTEKTLSFKSRVPFFNSRFVCGLAWKSNNTSFGAAKTVRLNDFGPVLKNPDVEFINLQYGEVNSEIREAENLFDKRIHQMEGLDLFNCIDDLLALINACDFVITTSNLTAHLAGSIGKKGCVLVPFSTGRIWYWHLDDDQSLWYPSLRVLYQEGIHDWTKPILEAREWIKQNFGDCKSMA